MDFVEAETRFAQFARKLESVSPTARKLLVHAAELAYFGRGQDRGKDVAYLPELHESCGLDVEAMYEYLEELKRAQLVAIEGEYPFEDVRLLSEGDDFPLATIAEQSKRSGFELRDVVVDRRFDLLK
jgi:hypothetical protein